MDQMTKNEYIEKFGYEMFKEKVLEIFNDTDDTPIDCIYCTDNGNIFMVMKGDE